MRKIVLCGAAVMNSLLLSAQKNNPWTAQFGVQIDAHRSTLLDAHKNSANSYFTGTLRNNTLEFGLRYEHLTLPLPGHEEERGQGLSHFYAKWQPWHNFDLTAGDFYEQFGSGLVFRSYEDRDLGIDNAVRGARLSYSPYQDWRIKVLGGQVRHHFDRGSRLFRSDRGFLWGADAEVGFRLPSLFPLAFGDVRLGASYLMNHQDEQLLTRRIGQKTYRLVQPLATHTFGARLHSSQGGKWDSDIEVAFKTADPNATNHYTFGMGSALMYSLSYADKGASAYLGLRRSENFDHHAERYAQERALRLNHLLPFTYQQTYSLAALYPYATQPQGEWAVQAEGRYTLPRGTRWGGRYGTKLRFSGSYIAGLTPAQSDTVHRLPHEKRAGTNGVRTKPFGWGSTYFYDATFEVSRKVSSAYSFTALYSHQAYNQWVIEGHMEEGQKMIHSHTFVYDGKHRLSPTLSLRTEAQYLYTRQAEGDWLYALTELSFAPRFVFTLSDQWNVGKTKQHYFMAALAGSFGNHRVQLGFGRTRAGINCSGGVCRYVPATKGWYLSYNATF